MSETQWKTAFAAVAAIAAFLLAQADIELLPIAKVALGALLVALAAINPDRG